MVQMSKCRQRFSIGDNPHPKTDAIVLFQKDFTKKIFCLDGSLVVWELESMMTLMYYSNDVDLSTDERLHM